MPADSVTSPTLSRFSLTKAVPSCPMRLGAVTNHCAASNADYEGGDYSREAEAVCGMSLETQASVRRMKTFNLNSGEWDATRDREGWRCSGTLVGERIGGELLGATMSQIEPGSRLWPY